MMTKFLVGVALSFAVALLGAVAGDVALRPQIYNTANATTLVNPYRLAVVGGECTGLLICQNFEVAAETCDPCAEDNGESWSKEPTGSGYTMDVDYSAPALRGSESYGTSGTSDNGWLYLKSPTWAGTSPTHAFFRFRANTSLNNWNTSIFYLYDATDTEVARIRLDNDGTPMIYHGSASAVNWSLQLAANTTYYFWIDYTPGTGANGILNWYHSTTTTKPGSPTLSITTGTSTTNPIYLKLTGGYNSGGGIYLYDQVYVDDSVIGDVSP